MLASAATSDTPGSNGGTTGRDSALPARRPWLLLIHHLPPKPDYLRVKVRRRLERLGALPVKSSVYVLPMRDETLEDFQWLAREIVADGGEATVCGASFLEGMSDDGLVASFVEARAAHYADIVAAADAVERAGAATPGGAAAPGEDRAGEAALARLARRLATVAAVDYFDAPARAAAEGALRAAGERLRGVPAHSRREGGALVDAPRGRTWVTRTGVFVDRIASAWLIRRFIDPDARFAFVASPRHRPAPGEVRFDMFEAEYTHEADRCTFETLLERFDLRDPVLAALAEVVHEIDLKDEMFGRAETAGVAVVLAGIAATTPDDATRLERGAALFDGLYAALGGTGQ